MNKLLKEYLISSIDCSGYECEDDTLVNVKEISKSEKSRMNWNVATVKDWLLGLPSTVNIDFTYYDIKNRLKSIYDDDSIDRGDYEIQNEYYWLPMATMIYNAK